jgi:hypothetical protein
VEIYKAEKTFSAVTLSQGYALQNTLSFQCTYIEDFWPMDINHDSVAKDNSKDRPNDSSEAYPDAFLLEEGAP